MNLVLEFLTNIRRFVLAQNGDELRNWLKVENTIPNIDVYRNLGQALKSNFPANSDALEKLVDKCLPEEDDVQDGKGSPWPGFNSFIKEFLEYWRDVDFKDIVKVHSRLSDLLISCANALANPAYGNMLLQTSISLSESLSKLVIGLTRRPQLLSQIQGDMTGDEGGEKKSIVELAADIIQKIFTSCLTDRSSTRWQPPKGKKVAIYLFANLTLKLLFACEKSRLAVQMFTNLSTQGPALSLYPASQRVTFLYYLGRFNFDYDHYFRAHMCFEEAYRQCPPQFQKHRRKILTYWIPANLLMGRFPSRSLLARPEAAGFSDIFVPICGAVRSGNFVAFHQALARSGEWLWKRGLYLTFLYRLKQLVWRSFIRRTFLLTWQGSVDESSNKAASLSLDDLVTTASYVQKLLEGYVPAQPAPKTRPPHINTIFLKPVANAEGEADSLLVPPPGGPRRLMPSAGLIYGNKKPTLENIEPIVASLVYAGLMNGFIARTQKKFAVEGAKRKGGNAVLAGWPSPYEAIMERFKEGLDEAKDAFESGESTEDPGDMNDVPGWVRGP
ncbi:protein CSN12 [Diplogelasinospora grovesii]|uniref:Protein CSN12 n=1 Tax=Diplogelasinospora grovesii TaxID=303347 RepID=A0AAN6NFX8_9PEZI|nr:protein CSN12 [Diplogelasinospora grovesii]